MGSAISRFVGPMRRRASRCADGPRRPTREPVTAAPLLRGAHVSSAGGIPEAPARAAAIDATAMQLFTKMANRWAERTCEDDECTLFRARLAETRVTATMA